MASGSFAVASSNKYVSATIHWSSTTNIAGNYSEVYCELRASRTNSGYTTYGSGYGTINVNGYNIDFEITPSQKITQNSNTLLGSGKVTVYHNDNGAKTITISTYVSIPGANLVLGTTSGSATLDTIPRKSSLTVSDGVLGTAQTITVTRQSTSFTHTIAYTCGIYNGYVCKKSTDTSLSFTPELYFADGAPYGTSVYVSFTITTYNGNTSVGSNSYAIWCTIPDSVKPTVSFSVSDYTDYASKFGAYIQNRSKFAISVNASGAYGSSIASYSVNADGKTYSTYSVTTDVIATSGTLTISVTVTDSRGRTATASTQVTVLPYNNPKITAFTVKRCDESGNASSSGEYLNAAFSWELTSLNNQNSKGFTLKYKKKSDSTYTVVDLAHYYADYSQAGNYIFEADPSSGYDVQLIVADYFTSTMVTQNGPATSKLFSILRKGLGFAFGKVAELENTLEVAFDAVFHNKVDMKSDLTVHGACSIDGGLRYSIQVVNANFNDMNISGTYYMGTLSTNRPDGANGWLTVHDAEYDTNTCYQRYVTYTGTTYERWKQDGAWLDWNEVQTKKTNYLWDSVITVGSWSRICYIPYGHGNTGSCGIVSVTFTRLNVVGNATFAFNVSHSRDCRLTLLGSNHYTGFRVRGVVDSVGNVYIEILDELYDESGTKQTVHCSFIPTIAGKPTLYTSATSGTTIPTDYAAGPELLVNTKQPYTKFEINVTLEANAYVPPYSYYKTIDISSYSSYGYLINASANDTAGAPVPVSMDTDNAKVRISSNTSNVVLKLTYMRALST